ncbi:MAG TPA: GNAT family N-acetyltransferase [Bradyrhizobium sp.]
MTHVTLRPATIADIPFIMATERQPGYEPLVGRFPEEEHRACLTDDDWLYFIARDAAGTDKGFAILQNVKTEKDAQFLRRIAVVDAGKGFGRPFLCAVVGWVFANMAVDRFWFSVRNTNERARHVYRSLGFRQEGPERGDASSSIMSTTRAGWAALTAARTSR